MSAIRDSKLPREVFSQWLVQDYLFAKGATSFLAIAVAKTPRRPRIISTGTLNALPRLHAPPINVVFYHDPYSL